MDELRDSRHRVRSLVSSDQNQGAGESNVPDENNVSGHVAPRRKGNYRRRRTDLEQGAPGSLLENVVALPKLTPQRFKFLVDAVAAGAQITGAAVSVGINLGTVLRWIERGRIAQSWLDAHPDQAKKTKTKDPTTAMVIETPTHPDERWELYRGFCAAITRAKAQRFAAAEIVVAEKSAVAWLHGPAGQSAARAIGAEPYVPQQRIAITGPSGEPLPPPETKVLVVVNGQPTDLLDFVGEPPKLGDGLKPDG